MKRERTRPTTSLKAWFPPLLLGVTVAGVGLWADSVARGVVEGRVRDQLRLGLEANVRAVEMWMEAQEATVRLVAENARVLALAAELMAASRKPGMTDDALRELPTDGDRGRAHRRARARDRASRPDQRNRRGGSHGSAHADASFSSAGCGRRSPAGTPGRERMSERRNP